MPVPDPPEYHAAQRTHEKTHGKHAKGGNQGSNVVVRRKKELRDDRSKKTIQGKVIPLHDVADNACNDRSRRMPFAAIRFGQGWMSLFSFAFCHRLILSVFSGAGLYMSWKLIPFHLTVIRGRTAACIGN